MAPTDPSRTLWHSWFETLFYLFFFFFSCVYAMHRIRLTAHLDSGCTFNRCFRLLRVRFGLVFPGEIRVSRFYSITPISCCMVRRFFCSLPIRSRCGGSLAEAVLRELCPVTVDSSEGGCDLPMGISHDPYHAMMCVP